MKSKKLEIILLFLQLKETKIVLNTIMEVQAKEDNIDNEKSTSDTAYELARIIMERIILKIDPDNCHSNHLEVNIKIIH